MTKEIKENIKELIQHSLDQDFNKANQVFGQAMSNKLGDILDQEKIQMAGHVFNNEEEIEDDDALADEAVEEDDEENGEDDEDDVEVEEAALGDDVGHSRIKERPGKTKPTSGRTDPEGSGSAQPKEPKKPARKLGLSPGALGGKAKPGLSPGAMGGKVKTKPKVKSKGGDRHPPKMKKKEEGPTEKQVNDWIRSEAPGMRKSYDSFNKVRKSEKIKW